MSICQHCGQGALAHDKKGPVCPDCIEDGWFDDGTEEPVWSPHLSPEVFDEIKSQLKRYNAAFDASVESLTINGVRFYAAPF
tara:strand:+ start:89 stop:334 length:246 start_codon:yes stop_codon:yes gene_type:complete